VLAHASRQLYAWLIFNVGQKRVGEVSKAFLQKFPSTRAFFVQVFSSVSFQFSAAIDAILKFGVWKKDGVFSPQFSKSQEVGSLFPLCEFSKSISYAGHVFRRDGPKVARMKPTEPNQALEPTTTAVTPRADARVAPAAVVAHL
jgi:hypothetical protein